MASFFGEVIHPSSRAFWSDEDDEDTLSVLDNQQEIKFTLKWSDPEPTLIEKLIIVEGEMAIDFVKACLLENAKIICTIECVSEKSYSQIYLADNIYIVTVSTTFNLSQAGQFTETIIPLLSKSKNIFTLTSRHISDFKSEEEPSASFLRTLCSSTAKNIENYKIPTLNQPNIISGVCAGVLTFAEVSNLHCIMYILYTDTFILDSKNALPLTELFSQLLKKQLPNFTTGNSNFFKKGNLYL